MANRFTDSFNQTPSYQNNPDINSQLNSFAQDPYGIIMQNKGINIPPEYRNNYKQAAMYCLQNSPGINQNWIFSMAKKMMGMR